MTDDDYYREMMTAFDAPAFIRRAKKVEDAWELICERCRRQRQTLLEMPRLRLAQLAALAGDWSEFPPGLCPPADVDALADLHQEWRPRLRRFLPPAESVRPLQTALEELAESFARFNRRWRKYVDEIDLAPLNQLRADYNRYYVLEKECALRSSRRATDGFRRLPPATPAEVLREFPLLPVPRITRN